MSETTETNEKLGSYNGDLYTATVTCEGAGVVCEESAEVKITQPGIRIHLMRAALINRSKKYAPKLLKDISEENFKELKLDGLPTIKLSNYKYAGTILQPGYIYVIDDKNPDGWSEWEITELGELIEISKDQIDKDERASNSKSRKIRTYIAKPTDTLWFAYSSVQWSSTYFKKMQKDCETRENRMQKFDGSKHVNKQSQTNTYGPRQVSHSISFLSENIFDQTNTQKNWNIAATDKENCEVDYELDTVLFLHDPLGILIELTTYLKYLWHKMDALMMSLKIGVHSREIQKALRRGIDPKTLQNSKSLEQIEALYNIAVNINSVAFANEENIDKIGEEIDAERLKLVLATKERLALKKKIALCRSVLIDFLRDDYLEIVENDYLENCNAQIANIKGYKANLISELWQPPNFKDAFLETAQEARKWNSDTQKGKAYIKDVLQGKTALGKIFTTPSIIEEIEGKANYAKFVGITNALFDIAKGVTEDGDKVLEDWVKVLNKNQIKIKGVLQDTAIEITKLGKEFRKSELGRTDFSKKTLNINKKSIKAFKKASKQWIKGFSELMEARQIAFTVSFEKAIENDTLSGISKFQDSPFWTKLLRNFSFLNLGLAAVALRKSDNEFQKYLNIGKFFTAIADVHVSVRSVNTLKLSKKLNQEALDLFKAETVKRARIVGYVNVLIDASEAGLNFWERDYDAAAAYTASAALGLAGLLLTAGAVNGWNPVGWGCILIGACIGFYATYLEDSPLERIAKNGIFGDIPTSFFQDVVTFKGDYIAQINQHVLPTVRDAMHKTGFTDWEDLTKQYVALMDVLVSGRIQITIIKDEPIGKIQNVKIGSYASDSAIATIRNYKINKIQIEATFGAYLTNREQLEYQLYYLPNGFGESVLIEDVTDKVVKSETVIKTEPEKAPKAVWSVNVNTLPNINKFSKFMILAKITINDSQHIPVPLKNTSRYVGTLVPLIRRDYSTGITYNNGFHDRVFIGTKSELLKKDKWK